MLRAKSLKLGRVEPAIPNRVLQPLVPQECGSGLEVGAPDQIEATGMPKHVRMDFQSGEFGWQFEPIEHSPERGWLHPEHPIRRPQPWRTQWPQEALVLLGEGMLAGLRSFQAANQYAPLLPLDVGPAQTAQFGDAQAVVEGYPDRSGVPYTVSVPLGRLAQSEYLSPTQVLAGAALLVGDALWPELCSIFGIWRWSPEARKSRTLPRSRRCICSITA
jgi:hypothetical protein